MANSWGELSWSTGAWGEQNDITASLTGIALTGTLDSVTTAIDVSPIPNSFPLSSSSGNISPIITVDVFPAGNSLSIAEGNLDADPDANITGIQLTANLGNAIAYNEQGWGRYFYGEWVWGASGIWANVDLTGIELTANLGSIAEVNGTAVVDINDPTDAFSLLAQEGYIDANPDANPVGVAMTAALSSVTPLADANVDLTGFAITASLGTAVLVPSQEVDLSGFALTMALNSVDYDADGFVELTGNSLTISEGTVYNLIWNEVDTGTVVPWTEVDTAA